MDKGRVKPDSGLNLREKPNGELVSVLGHDQLVDIIDQVTFYRVRTSMGEVGYVHGDYLEKMPAENTAINTSSLASLSDEFVSVLFESDYFVGEVVKVDRDFVPALQRVADFAKKCKLKIYVTSSTRSLRNQVRGAIVPPAGNSCHHIGHAIDMNIVHRGKHYNSQRLARDNLANLPAAIGKFINLIRDDDELRWGGDFNTEDPVHIDDNFYHREKILYTAKVHSRVLQLNA